MFLHPEEGQMRRPVLALATLLMSGSCVAASPPEPDISGVTTNVVGSNQDCEDYTARATIGGQEQVIAGRACQQPGGSWIVAEGPPDRPATYVIVYPPPVYGIYPPYDLGFWGVPIGFSVGTLVFVDREHRVHRFNHFRQFAFREPHEGGFHRGFGFGGMRGGRHG
jgi:hypothetical protein